MILLPLYRTCEFMHSVYLAQADTPEKQLNQRAFRREVYSNPLCGSELDGWLGRISGRLRPTAHANDAGILTNTSIEARMKRVYYARKVVGKQQVASIKTNGKRLVS